MLVEAPTAGVMFWFRCRGGGRRLPATELTRMNRQRRRTMVLLPVVLVLAGYLSLPHGWDFRVPALLALGLWILGTRVI